MMLSHSVPQDPEEHCLSRSQFFHGPKQLLLRRCHSERQTRTNTIIYDINAAWLRIAFRAEPKPPCAARVTRGKPTAEGTALSDAADDAFPLVLRAIGRTRSNISASSQSCACGECARPARING